MINHATNIRVCVKSLADLYVGTTMPPELRRAHKDNDNAVLAAYGFSKNITESEIVAELMKMYQELTAKKRKEKNTI